jgi:hypothetical protein
MNCITRTRFWTLRRRQIMTFQCSCCEHAVAFAAACFFVEESTAEGAEMPQGAQMEILFFFAFLASLR